MLHLVLKKSQLKRQPSLIKVKIVTETYKTQKKWFKLNQFPKPSPVCLTSGKDSINDFATRPAKGMADGEVLHTGKYRFRLLHTPHVPHCWDAGLLFEEETKTLFCSDLFHQNGDVEPLTESSIMERVRQTLVDYQAGPLANYMPYTQHTEQTLYRLADLQPKTIAIMHGSTFTGNGERALQDLATVMREVLGSEKRCLSN